MEGFSMPVLIQILIALPKLIQMFRELKEVNKKVDSIKK